VADSETPTGGAGVNGELILITRDDGSQQVALDGAALYLYRDDSAPGESHSQDVGDKWFVIDGDGTIVQTLAAEPSGPTEPAAGLEMDSGGIAGLISGGDDAFPLVVALMLIGTVGLVFVGRSAFPAH
jgi:hypothetical protein